MKILTAEEREDMEILCSDHTELRNNPWSSMLRRALESDTERERLLAEKNSTECIVREEFSLPEGPVIIVFPDIMSAESVAEVEEWFALLTRKLKRWSVEQETL